MSGNGNTSDNGGGFVISKSMMMQASAFLMAGILGGGGGVSLMATPKEELASLKNSVDVVAMTLQEIKSDMKYARNDLVRLEEKQKDFEVRIRSLERTMREH